MSSQAPIPLPATTPSELEAERDLGYAERMLDDLIEQALVATSVDTHVAGQHVASTRITMSGNLVCSLAPGLDAEALARHRMQLSTALRERQARAKLLGALIEMAAKITLAASALNPLLALPMAVKFMRDVLSERHARAETTRA